MWQELTENWMSSETWHRYDNFYLCIEIGTKNMSNVGDSKLPEEKISKYYLIERKLFEIKIIY